MRKALFIYNPLSGNRNVPGRLDRVIERFSNEGIQVIPYRTISSDRDKLREILTMDEFSFVVVSGGDGTISSIINTMFFNNINLPVGIIPAGTCNDLARSLNIPSDLNKSLDIIMQGNTLDIDTGLINENLYFLNTCSGGMFVDVTFNTSGELKRNIGLLAYYLQALSEVAVIKHYRIRLKTDETSLEEEVLLFIILNGKHAGGFSNVNRKADITDGIMDIILIKNCYHIDLAGLFIKALNNDLMSDKNVISLRARSCAIEADSNVVLSVDGEKGPTLPISVKFINKSLKVFVK